MARKKIRGISDAAIGVSARGTREWRDALKMVAAACRTDVATLVRDAIDRTYGSQIAAMQELASKTEFHRDDE